MLTFREKGRVRMRQLPVRIAAEAASCFLYPPSAEAQRQRGACPIVASHICSQALEFS